MSIAAPLPSEVLNLPDQPRFARAGDGLYYTWDGRKLVRVTSVVDMFTGGHLTEWYAKMAATECADLVARRQAGEMTLAECDAMLLDSGARMTAAIRYRDHKGAIGTICHRATHERLLGISMPKGDDLLDYLRGMAICSGLADPERDHGAEPYSLTLARESRHYYVRQSHWWDEALQAGAEVEAVGLEAMILGLTYDYAGTGDLFGRFPVPWLRQQLGAKFPEEWGDWTSVPLCGDYKTSNQLNVTKVRMQVAAYRNGDAIGLIKAEGTDGALHPVPETAGGFALHVKPVDPCQMVAWADDPEDFEYFLSLRHVYGGLYERPMTNPRRRSKETPKAKDKGCPF